MKLPTELANYFDELNDKNLAQSLQVLAGDFSLESTFGLMADCFFKNNPVLFGKAIPWLKEAVQETGFMDGILRLERKRLHLELQDLHDDPVRNCFYIQAKRQQLDELNAKELYERARRMFDDLCSTMVDAKDFTADQCLENYYFTNLLRIIYEAHSADRSEQKRFERALPRSTSLYQYYLAADIDLLDSDAQYSKYNLYSITDDIELMIGIPNRVFDSRQPVQMLIEDTPKHVLELFERLRTAGLIENLALLVCSDAWVETDQRIFVTFGHEVNQLPLTYGFLSQLPSVELTHSIIRKSSLPIGGTNVFPSVSIFREPDSKDETWCLITSNSMTFEEIAYSPRLLEDCAVTQMIHLEYFVEDGRLCVSHIDHEYIFYTHEEFDLRAKDPYQKGSARKRLKTFKIDHSSVPFMLDDGTLFVHTLIGAFFKRPHLLMSFLLDMVLPSD